MDYPKEFKSNSHRSTIDTKNKIAYVLTTDSTLFTMHLNTKLIDKIDCDIYFGKYPKILYTNGDIHIVGGTDNTKHFMFNVKDQHLTEMHDFKRTPFLIPIYLTKTKSMLAMLDDSSMMQYMNGVWQNVHNLSLDYHFDILQCAVTKAQDYMMLIGGLKQTRIKMEESAVFVYDLINGKMTKSDIKGPAMKPLTAITTRNVQHDSLLTFGFINHCYKFKEFDGIQELPFYIIKFIEKWVCFELMYVIELTLSRQDTTPKHHWTIDVDAIIQSTLTKL